MNDAVKEKSRFNICPEWVVESLCLIHYGSNEYVREKFEPIKNDLTKPKGGLWTCPVGSDHSWEKWCRQNNFRTFLLDSHFKARFIKGSKILVIDSLSDLESLPKYKSNNSVFSDFFLDFELISDKFDAIWLTAFGEMNIRSSQYSKPYEWSCETVFVMNGDSIEQVK